MAPNSSSQGRNGRPPDSQMQRERDADCREQSVSPVQIRTGVDVQSISAFREFDPDVAAGIKDRAFTKAEQEYCDRMQDPAQHYAARWAAKEAFVKLLAGDRSVPFDEIDVVRHTPNPSLELGTRAKDALAASFGMEGVSSSTEPAPASLDVSLSHDRDADVAMAQVVALAGGNR